MRYYGVTSPVRAKQTALDNLREDDDALVVRPPLKPEIEPVKALAERRVEIQQAVQLFLSNLTNAMPPIQETTLVRLEPWGEQFRGGGHGLDLRKEGDQEYLYHCDTAHKTVTKTTLAGKVLWQKGVWMDADMNKYDLNHRVSHHPKMSDVEWEDAYRAAWKAYYTPEHVRTILRRSAACRRGRPGTTLTTILWFYLMMEFEGVHPLEGGALRQKFRRDRRHGLPRENPVLFYPRYLGETVVKMWRYWSVYKRFKSTLEDALAAADRWTYTDLAIAPPAHPPGWI